MSCPRCGEWCGWAAGQWGDLGEDQDRCDGFQTASQGVELAVQCEDGTADRRCREWPLTAGTGDKPPSTEPRHASSSGDQDGHPSGHHTSTTVFQSRLLC